MRLVKGLFLAALGNVPNQVLKSISLVAAYLFFGSAVKIVHGVNKIKPTQGLVKKKMGSKRFFVGILSGPTAGCSHNSIRK
jgi:hypothetical protein